MLAFDGPVATTALTVFQVFLVSVGFIAALSPFLLFTALIGWQATHLSLMLGALSLATAPAAVFALMRASARILDHRADAQAGRTFWRGFAEALRELWWLAAGVVGVVLIIGYDLALFHTVDAIVVVAALAAAAAVALVVAICGVADEDIATGRRDLVRTAVRRIARRPHVALCWPMLIGVAAAVATLPAIGPSAALFLPGLVGIAVQICNRTLGFLPIDETKEKP